MCAIRDHCIGMRRGDSCRTCTNKRDGQAGDLAQGKHPGTTTPTHTIDAQQHHEWVTPSLCNGASEVLVLVLASGHGAQCGISEHTAWMGRP